MQDERFRASRYTLPPFLLSCPAAANLHTLAGGWNDDVKSGGFEAADAGGDFAPVDGDNWGDDGEASKGFRIDESKHLGAGLMEIGDDVLGGGSNACRK